MARFSAEQIRRYSRQLLLREVGGHGQARLGAARPVLLCAGEVGQLAAQYLWRAGVTEATLLATTIEAAAQLSAQLLASGYPGPPVQVLSAAPQPLQRLGEAAPGYTLLWLTADDPDATPVAQAQSASARLLWACSRGSWGIVGQGAKNPSDIPHHIEQES